MTGKKIKNKNLIHILVKVSHMYVQVWSTSSNSISSNSHSKRVIFKPRQYYQKLPSD